MAHSTSHVPLFVSVAPGINAGTTSTVALLRDGIELVVGSVGDSRAMLCRKGKALKLTVDHTPERKDEKERYRDVVSSATSFTQSVYLSFTGFLCRLQCLEMLCLNRYDFKLRNRLVLDTLLDK